MIMKHEPGWNGDDGDDDDEEEEEEKEKEECWPSLVDPFLIIPHIIK